MPKRVFLKKHYQEERSSMRTQNNSIVSGNHSYGENTDES